MVGLSLGIALIFVALAFAGIPATGSRLRELGADPFWNLIQLLAAGVGFATVVILAARLSPTPFRERLGIGRGTLPLRGYLWVTLGGLSLDAAAVAIAVVLMAFGVPVPADRDVERMIQSLTLEGWPLRVALVVCMGVIPGIVEELLFRGYIQRRLLERWRLAVVIGLVAIVFAALHGWRGIYLVPGSVWLGYVAWRTGSIWPGVVYHTVGNSLTLTLALVFAWVKTPSPGSVELRDDAIAAVLAVVPLVFVFRSMWRRLERTPVATDLRVIPRASAMGDPVL
jgi:membrane protease YdiL (CAAX protease family)